MNKNIIVPKSQLRWNTVVENVNINWNNIYSISAKCCNNTKLHWFQYRILHRILATNYLLTKMNTKQSDQCTFCLAEPEKVEHLFWHCNVVNHFWQNIELWIYTKTDFLINIDKVGAIF